MFSNLISIFAGTSLFLPLTLQNFFSEPLGKRAIFGILQKLVKQTTKKAHIFALFGAGYMKPWKYVFCRFFADFLFDGTCKRGLLGDAHPCAISKKQFEKSQKLSLI